MAKIHLKISHEPVQGGTEVMAFCGEKVPNAEALPLADLNEGEPTAGILFCKRCFGSKYFYAIVSGQDAHDMEHQ